MSWEGIDIGELWNSRAKHNLPPLTPRHGPVPTRKIRWCFAQSGHLQLAVVKSISAHHDLATSIRCHTLRDQISHCSSFRFVQIRCISWSTHVREWSGEMERLTARRSFYHLKCSGVKETQTLTHEKYMPAHKDMSFSSFLNAGNFFWFLATKGGTARLDLIPQYMWFVGLNNQNLAQFFLQKSQRN